MDIRKKAKLLYTEALQATVGSGEDAVYRYYIDKALQDAYKHKDFFAYASHYFQQYNKDRRADLNKKKKAHSRIEAGEIPAVTQLFTPLHLADYIVENSLGRYLYECGIDLGITFANGNVVFGKYCKDIKDIKILDPAAGSGNLIFCAARLMVRAYKKQGCTDEAIKAALAGNFIGLDIDGRAAQLCRTLLQKEFGAVFDIITLQSFTKQQAERYLPWQGIYDGLLHLGERGSVSIFQQEQLAQICKAFCDKTTLDILKTLSIFNAKYDIILMNPPYLASSDCSKALLEFIKANFAPYKTDLFSVFMARCLQMLTKDGYMGVVCPFNWMFTKQFGGIRRHIFANNDIVNLAMLPSDDYKEAVVYLSCFVLYGSYTGQEGRYIKVAKGGDSANLLADTHGNYTATAFKFADTPYNSIMFWVSDRFISNYLRGRLSDVLEIRQGLATGDNNKYLKKISVLDASQITYDAVSIDDFDAKGRPYAPYNKGGAYRKWYGNIEYAIHFSKQARQGLLQSGNRMPSKAYYFKPCITWTLVSSKGHFGARISNNSVFDVGGSCGFAKEADDIYIILGYLCSNVATAYLNAQNPTINCQVGDIKNLPYIQPDLQQRRRITELVKQNIDIAYNDWHSAVSPSQQQAAGQFKKLKSNEEELNRIFIDIYGLQGEISPQVQDRLITLKYK